MTKNLNDLQTKYDKEVLLVTLNNNSNQSNAHSLVSQLTAELEQKSSVIHELNEKCNELEDQVRLYEALKLTGPNNAANSSNGAEAANQTHPDQSIVGTLQRELERSLNTIRLKRVEVQRCQEEIERLKSERPFGKSPLILNINVNICINCVGRVNKE